MSYIGWMLLIVAAFVVRFQQFVPLNKLEIVSVEMALLFAYIFLNRARWPQLLIRFDRWKSDVLIGACVGVGYCAVEYGWDYANGAVPTSLYWKSLLFLPLVLVIVGWASALYEELLFRSVLLSVSLRAFGRPWVAIVVQAALFGLAHWNRYFHEGMWYHAVSTTVFGLVLGVLAWQRRSFLPGWVAHALSNSYGVMFIPSELVLEKALGSWLH